MMKKNVVVLLLTGLSLGHVCGSSVQDYWKAEEYCQNTTSQKDAAKDLMQYVQIEADDRILDVGCGDGKITAEIGTRVLDGLVMGVDVSPSMIDFAKNTFPEESYSNLKFVLKDAGNLDFNGEFDIVFSFTTLQWVEDHGAFFEGAYKSLKPSGILAVTIPMGLPDGIQQAVTEIINMPEWANYFEEFSTGWNFPEAEEFDNLVKNHKFAAVRLAIVPQRDVFPSREVFENFIAQWFPYLRPLPENMKRTFLTQVMDRFFELENQTSNEVHFKIRRLEIVAVKL